MGKLKMVDMLMLAIVALVSAVKGVVKFIEYIIRLRARPATSTT